MGAPEHEVIICVSGRQREEEAVKEKEEEKKEEASVSRPMYISYFASYPRDFPRKAKSRSSGNEAPP